MNAYEILKLNEFDNDISSYDTIINTAAVSNIIKKINSLKQLIKDTSNAEQLLESFDIIIYDIMRDINAYHAIKSLDARKLYNKRGKPDIDFFTGEKMNLMMNSLHLRVHSIDFNPYQILSVAKDNNNTNLNVSIRNRTTSRFKSLLSQDFGNDINDLEKFFKQLFKYNWAYKALKTPECRQNLKFRLIRDKANKDSSFTGNIFSRSFKQPKKVSLFDEQNQDNNFIQIIEERELISKPFNLEENFLHEYLILRKINDKQYNRSIVYSNIDMNRMKTDIDYQKLVTEQLLNTSSIELGKQFLNGYIGELNESGTIDYVNENLAGLLQYTKQKEKTNEIKKNLSHDNR